MQHIDLVYVIVYWLDKGLTHGFIKKIHSVLGNKN